MKRLSEQESILMWKAAGETEAFVHWFFGYMASKVENLSLREQDDILNAAERFLKEK